MAKKFFTADFHLGMTAILQYAERPFSSIDAMNAAFIDECKSRAKGEDDVIYHIGDLCSFGFDRGNAGLSEKPQELLKCINAQFVNIRGNHDMNNKVKSIGESVRIVLSKKFPNVSLSHYPSYDRRVGHNCLNNEIHLCGHVHGKWKHCLDLSSNVMNINVGVDAWGYKIVSEDELIAYLNSLFRLNPDKLFKCKVLLDGRIMFYGNNDI